MRKIFTGLFFLLFLGARAQEPAAEPSVAELSAEVEALKAKTSTWDRILARLPEISGYVQTGYEWSESSSTFFIKRVRLNLTGAIAPKLDYRVQIEFASPKIVDAYVRYRPFDQLNFQLGEFKLGKGTSIAYEKVNELIKFQNEDIYMGNQSKATIGLIESDELLNAVEAAVGEL